MALAERMLLSGDEAVALAALDGGVVLGTGYPGTPSTEILEALSKLVGAEKDRLERQCHEGDDRLESRSQLPPPPLDRLESRSHFGGPPLIDRLESRSHRRVQWAPNEKVALEVGLGAAYGGAAALVTMKHVGLNVAADPLFTAAYTGVTGPLVVVSADDPGMASSQNEQDNRHYALAAGVPMVEPADSQEAYDFLLAALGISRRWGIPVLLRMTTRVCHSKSIVRRGAAGQRVQSSEFRVQNPGFTRDIPGRVMIPAYARGAHRRLRAKLAEIAAFAEASSLNVRTEGDMRPGAAGGLGGVGIITSGVTYLHAMEAAPGASVLKLGLTYPLALETIRKFAAAVRRCVVVEEGDAYLAEAIRAAGITAAGGAAVESKPEMYRFGELNVERVRRILAGDVSAEAEPVKGKPPQLCVSCPYHAVFQTFKDLDCIVAGDIGCYTLGVLPPYEAMDTCVCMGASVGVGLGLRHVLAEQEARRVVSVIGDSTFVHSGISGLVEMVYNPPATGHVVVILDNGTTAMTGQQEHPGTGRTLEHEPTGKVRIEELARALGIKRVVVTDPMADVAGFRKLMEECLAGNELAVIIVRRPCLLAAGKIREYERRAVSGP